MKSIEAALAALGNLKGQMKTNMAFRKRNAKNPFEDPSNEAEVPDGAAAKPTENPAIYGETRLPDNLQGLDDDEQEGVIVVSMSGKKMPKVVK